VTSIGDEPTCRSGVARKIIMAAQDHARCAELAPKIWHIAT
jgi:hypothetical protein